MEHIFSHFYLVYSFSLVASCLIFTCVGIICPKIASEIGDGHVCKLFYISRTTFIFKCSKNILVFF